MLFKAQGPIPLAFFTHHSKPAPALTWLGRCRREQDHVDPDPDPRHGGSLHSIRVLQVRSSLQISSHYHFPVTAHWWKLLQYQLWNSSVLFVYKFKLTLAAPIAPIGAQRHL